MRNVQHWGPDSFDLRILECLMMDAGQTMQSIGDQVGLSSNACWRRVKKMEEVGVITGKTVTIDAARLGLVTTVFVAISIDHHGEDWLKSFSKCVERIPEIVECHRLNGETDYLLKVMVRDIEHYDAVYRAMIKQVPDLRRVSSSISMQQLKARAHVDMRTLQN